MSKQKGKKEEKTYHSFILNTPIPNADEVPFSFFGIFIWLILLLLLIICDAIGFLIFNLFHNKIIHRILLIIASLLIILGISFYYGGDIQQFLFK